MKIKGLNCNIVVDVIRSNDRREVLLDFENGVLNTDGGMALGNWEYLYKHSYRQK